MGSGTATMVGNQAPPFSLPDTEGNLHEFSSAGDRPVEDAVIERVEVREG